MLNDNNEQVVIKRFRFIRNKHGFLTYQGKPLGVLKWGDPALVAALGDIYSSPAAFDAWLKELDEKILRTRTQSDTI